MKAFVVLAVALMVGSCSAGRNFLKSLSRRNLGELSDCPISSCNLDFWKSYNSEPNKCSEFLKAADDCYAKLKDDLCACSDDKALEAHTWQAYLRDIYDDTYCKESKGCKSSEAQACATAYSKADEYFFTTKSGSDATTEQRNTVQEAIDCVAKDLASPLDTSGCGWDTATIRADRSMFAPLWAVWSEGCMIHDHVETCFDYIRDFDDTICHDDKFKEFADCSLAEFAKDSKCSSMPTDVQSFKDKVFGHVVDDRCPVVKAVDECEVTREVKDKPMKRLMSLIEKLASQIEK